MSSAALATPAERFLAAVSHYLTAEQMLHDVGRFTIDGCTPALAVAPTSVEQLRLVLTEAHSSGAALIPVGGLEHVGFGNAPRAYDVALSLAGMSRIVAHEPADMTVTVEPGVTLAALDRALAEHGQCLPLDPPCGASATVGGVVAANAFGPLRHAFGTARDWLIGTLIVHAGGVGSRSGGRVVKNVTGYDMHKLYVGSLGTLGVIAEATFKLAPLPRVRRTAGVYFDSPEAACGFVLAARDEGLALHAAEVLAPAAAGTILGQARWSVLARVAGGQAAVDRTLRDLQHASGPTVDVRDDEGAWQAWSDAFRPASLSLRAGVQPAAVARVLRALDEALGSARPLVSATVAGGVLRVRVDGPAAHSADTVERARAAVAQAGGTLVLDAAPAPLKQQLDVFGPTRSDFAIMRRLKEQFDSRGVLAPGRFMGRL